MTMVTRERHRLSAKIKEDLRRDLKIIFTVTRLLLPSPFIDLWQPGTVAVFEFERNSLHRSPHHVCARGY